MKKYGFFIILLIGVLHRAAWLVYIPTVPISDFAMYNNTAAQIARGDFNIGAFVTPGYQITLGIVYAVFGTNILVGKVFNILLSALIMFLTFRIAEKLFGFGVAIASTALIAVSPLAAAYCNVIGTEILFCTIFMLCIYYIMFKRNPYILGILMGYLILVRPIALFFPAVIILYVLFKQKDTLGQRLKYIAIFIVITMAALAPWVVRNYVVIGKAVLSNNGGLVLYINNNQYATGSWSDPYKYPDSPIKKYVEEHGYDEAGLDRYARSLGVNWIISNPQRFLELGLVRLKNAYLQTTDIVWSFFIGESQMHPLTEKAIHYQRLLYIPFYAVAAAYMFYAAFCLVRYRKADFNSFALVTFLYFSAMMFALEGQSRYVFPLHPMFSIGCSLIIYKLAVRTGIAADVSAAQPTSVI